MRPYFTPDAVARFWSKVDRSGDPDACWLWTAGCFDSGYGVFSYQRKNLRAHVVAYWLTSGEIPEGLILRHSCDTPRCCNPSHLQPGTNAENSADMVRRGRSLKGIDPCPPERRARGERNGYSTLTEEIVREIQARYVRGHKSRPGNSHQLAEEFGLHYSHVVRIATGKAWKHVTGDDNG